MAEIKVRLIANYLNEVNEAMKSFGFDSEIHADGSFLIVTANFDDKINDLPHKKYLEIEQVVLDKVKESFVGQVFKGVKIIDAELVKE